MESSRNPWTLTLPHRSETHVGTEDSNTTTNIRHHMKTQTDTTKDQAPKTPKAPKASAPKAKPEPKAKAAKEATDTDGEATDRLPTTVEELKESKSGLVTFLFLSGKDKVSYCTS